jgi:Uma2 family endonuclease
VAALPDALVHRFSSEEYERLVELGVFEDARVELVDGWLVDMSPQGDQHVWTVKALMRLLDARRDLLFVQTTLRLGDGWTPEPDILLVDATPGSRLPTPLLVIEVAVTSQAHDRHKAQAYLRAGVPQVWLVDVPARAVTVLTPGGEQLVRGTETLDPQIEGLAPFGAGEVFARAGLDG